MQRHPDYRPSLSTSSTGHPAHEIGAKSARIASILLGLIALAGFAGPAHAERAPKTRLVNCGIEQCLEVTGHRSDPAYSVAINGNAVLVEGNQGWRVRIPLKTVREWSAPFARTIEISVSNMDTGHKASDTADLPIGLLGGTTELASLQIRAR